MPEPVGVYTLYHGNTLSAQVNVTDATGAAKDLTGASITWVLKTSEAVPDTQALVTKSTANGGVTITDETVGVFTITLVPADTKTLSYPAAYYHEGTVTDASGNVSTVIYGTIQLM